MYVLTAIRDNLAHARFDRHELAGALGDLGTFLPLLLALSQRAGVDFSASLLFAGLCNVATGLAFTIPMPVQPMKAIAAVALAQGLGAAEIAAAGAIVGVVVLFLGATGLVTQLARLIPTSVVRGVQLGLGLALALQACKLVLGTGSWVALDGYGVALGGAVIALLLGGRARLPAALVLFGAGLVLAILRDPGVIGALEVGVTLTQPSLPNASAFAVAAEKLALPQLPLTLLNSVIAVCALSATLYPSRAASPRKVAISVGLMSVLGVCISAMPLCHGAGGLAAQHRFGARTNGSVLFLGAVKILCAIVFGSSLLALAQAFPASLLGVLLFFAGMELALAGRPAANRDDAFVTLATAGLSLGTGDAAIGVVAGLMLALFLRWRPTI